MEVINFKDKYNKLSSGEKRLIRQKYTTTFYCRWTFYRTIKNERSATKAELEFLINNLK